MSPVRTATEPTAFSTVGLPEHQRVELWEGHNADALIGLRCRTLDATALEATEINVQLERVHLARVRGTSHVVERNAEMIRRSPTGAVAMFFGLAGEAFFYHDGGVRTLRPGQLLVCDADRPFMRGFAHGLEELVLKIPRGVLADVAGLDGITDPLVADFADANSFAHTLARHVGQAARAENPRPADENLILGLVSALVGDSRTAPPSTLWAAACSHIERHLSDPALSASKVAAAIGVSTRHLSRVFAQAGTSLPKYVLDSRLDAARAMLQEPAAMSMTIAEIAHHCGFASAAHFSNAFTSHFGERATDVRRRTAAARASYGG